MITFQDILKDGFLQNSTNISALSIGVNLFLAFIIGMFIFQVYKKTYQSVVYTKSFNIALVMMTVVTSLVILAVTSNVVLSLGMVGALSIVRFRSAIKDPMDIVFMFWSIAAGIIIGAGFYLLAVIGSLVVGVIIFVLTKNVKNDTPYILLISFKDDSAEKHILDKIKSTVDKYFVKSKIVNSNNIELTVELRIKNGEFSFINELQRMDSVSNAMLVSSNEFSS
ncbi:DUF4956 domain-containing protein [Oceanirhabdus seepicola]|uniref:DUF4956 domain-containing protein n=1 Tax=Oceanirhabdus seepicola TaxID=2828781 RepID=A0A9J6P0A0_9CLOT|nr:DUF4956 domain-containing protein [Oceanirhabdus seepicola]MCM1989537.1 DUF4956 domain-containing protein [Oceanirhabdus seepicola]